MSNTTFRAVSSVGAAVAAVLASSLSAGIANAQQGEHATHALEEVVVTARKTDESLQETPVAVTAFTAESISDRQLQTVNDVARFTPGLVFDKAFGRTGDRPVIRGQGNVLANVQFGVEAGAAYFVDGIYYPGSVQTLDITEVERVEVIKGPQSALYGRNTYSGAINFVTRDPSNEFHAAAKVSYDKDEQNYSLRFEGPLVGDTLTGSVSLRKYDFDGQWKNTLSGEQIGQEGSEGITGVLQWKPTEDLRIKLRGVYNEDRDGTRPFMFQGSAFNNCYQGTRSLAYYASSYTNGVKNANWNPYQYFWGFRNRLLI